MPIVFTLIVVLEAAIALAIGTVLIAAFISAGQKTWAECFCNRPIPPTLAAYRSAFAVEPELEWVAV